MQSAQHHGGLPAALRPLPSPRGLSQTDYYRITFTLGPCGCEEGGRAGAEPLLQLALVLTSSGDCCLSI